MEQVMTTRLRLLAAAVVSVAITAAGCGGGQQSPPIPPGDQGSDDPSVPEGNGGTPGGEATDQTQEEQFVITTVLDFGMPFAEDPSFSGTAGPLAVDLLGERGAGSWIDITLTNEDGSTIPDLRMVADITGEPLFDPTETHDPESVTSSSDAHPITSAEPTQGECELEATTALDTRVTCDLGSLASGEDVRVRLLLARQLFFTVTVAVRV